jgi:hypothetical protein
MNVAFVTTCKNRTQHLERTLPKNLADNPNSLFVVVDYSSQDHLLDYLEENHAREIESGRLLVYSYPGVQKFHMTHAKNLAHRIGINEGADVLVNLDADNFAGPGFEDYAESYFSKSKNIFLYGNMVKGAMPRGICGRIAVTKEAFIKSGGYDEKFTTWASDDKDLTQRLLLLGYEGVPIEPGFLDAVRHNDKMRFREYPEMRQAGNCCQVVVGDQVERTAVVNGGKFGCGTVYRNLRPDAEFPWAKYEKVELKPLPTRIFGIGMHRTATTSLHKAFEILGYESAHWPSAHWAKAVWREMNAKEYSPTLERTYTSCDLPIPLLYRQLDKAYPGSKFVLTTRDEFKWLKSVRRHWDRQHNEFRSTWDSDPFSHRIHQILYGRTDFEWETFLERYRRHNAEVLDYFKDRPQDLLTMNMDHGAGWPELCGFLNISPHPVVSYPGK